MQELRVWAGKPGSAAVTRYDERGYVFLGTAAAATLAMWIRT
ncbi:hypothetical protein [Streptomyces sp. NPDC056049]